MHSRRFLVLFLLAFLAGAYLLGSGGADASIPSGSNCADLRANAPANLNALVPKGAPGCQISFANQDLQSAQVDTRVRVTPTTGWPWRAIAQISSNNGAYICTGFFLGPHTVMTAAHCLYNPVELGGWATSVSVTPGMDGNTAPYGTQQGSSWSVADGWVLYETNGYDFGLITLPNDNLGNQVGWFTYQAATQAMVGSTANLSGYPGDKTATTQWEDSGQVKDLSAASISYDIYTYAGVISLLEVAASARP